MVVLMNGGGGGDYTMPLNVVWTVGAIGTPKASLTGLKINCRQLDNTMKSFIYPSATPSAVPGAGNLSFNSKDIMVKNVGTVDGKLFIRVKDETGKQIYYSEFVVIVGQEVWNAPFAFAMPTHATTISIDVGHLGSGPEVDEAVVISLAAGEGGGEPQKIAEIPVTAIAVVVIAAIIILILVM